MMIGCMGLTDVTRYEVRYDSDRVINVAKNLGGGAACTERTSQRRDFELIQTVKIKTRHPVEGQYGREFPAICNHCGEMTA